MTIQFKPLDQEEIARLRYGLQRNGEEKSALKIGRDTSYLRSMDLDPDAEIKDDEVISAIKSVPCHYQPNRYQPKENIMALLDYPKDLPPEAWQTVIDALRGKFPPRPQAEKILWNAAGYALGQLDPPSAPSKPFLNEECAKHLEAWKSQPPGPEKFALLGNIPWGSILQAILAIIQQILAGKTSGG